MADACPTYTGDVAIATSTTDNLDFNGLQEIQGSFIAVNVTEVTVFSSSTLQTITGDLGLCVYQWVAALTLYETLPNPYTLPL